jgi:8-oxo-dGTP diphosphatase
LLADSLSMKREYPDVPLVGVGAIIIEQDRVVLVKRGQAPLQGEWSIPGGVLEVGETLRQAAVREVLEETGLRVEVDELLGVYDRILRDSGERTRYHYVLIDFLCRRIDGEPQGAGDAAEARWFTRSELAGLLLPPDTEDVIKLGFEKSASQRVL